VAVNRNSARPSAHACGGRSGPVLSMRESEEPDRQVRAQAKAGITARALGAPGAFGNGRCYPEVPRAGARRSSRVMDNTLKGLGGLHD